MTRHRLKRAGAACLLCRGRKVRCDATQNGVPCTNCKLDGTNCVVKSRVKKLDAHQHKIDLSSCDVHPVRTRPPKAFGLEQSTTLGLSYDNPDWKLPDAPQTTVQSGGELTASLLDPMASFHSIQNNYPPLGRRVDLPLCAADVMYSYYPFLSGDALPQLMYEDVHYLERLGCYRVPSRASLDDFVKAYFRYIHPHLPILDGGDFWRAYTSPLSTQTRTISIFVFQAMLFASCSFVPFSTIDRLGFNGFHHARATFYRRAKALFHVDSCRDALSSAQGALLLTHYVSSSDAKVNTYWLSNAIYLARSVNVHGHESLNKTSVQRWSQLERLWCCCLLRDRLLVLGLRRSMQIDAEDALLSRIEDRVLRTEAEESMVHDSTTKLALTKSFSALCSLAALLRRTLGILSLDPPYPGSGEMKMTTDKIQAYSDLLDQWFTKAKVSCCSHDSTDTAVILHNNVMYIYYYSAKVALWNHKMYNSVKNGCPVHLDFSEGRSEVETAIRGIDASLEQIAENGMLSFMPIAIVAHIAIPLVQHIMNIKVHRQQHDVSTHKRLSVYIAALNGLKERYEGVDRVLHHIRQIVTCLDGHGMSTSLSSDSQFLNDSPPDNSDGAGSFTYLPRLFLREMIIVQLALAKGQYPEDHELPPPLASPAASDANSTCTCLSNESWNLPELGDAFDSLMDAMSPAGAPVSKQAGNVYGDCGIMTEKPTSPAIAANFDDFHALFNDG